MVPTSHALERFNSRFPHLDLDEELTTLRQLKRREVKHLQQNCPMHGKYVTRNRHAANGCQYRVSDNAVFFVLSPKLDTIITVMH